MLAPIAFIVFWIVVALALFFVALSGGPRGARRKLQTPGASARRFVIVAFALIFVGLAIVVPSLVIAGTHNKNYSIRQQFAQTCGNCHTLAAAGTTGIVGPDLDLLAEHPAGTPDPMTVQRVLNAIRIGGTGDGRMPAGLLSGPQADQMAQFVATYAGRRG